MANILWAHSKPESQKGRLLKDQRFTMKNIPDTDTMSRLSLSEKGWKGSGLPEIGLTLSTLEYLASNWGLNSSWLTAQITIWPVVVSTCWDNSEVITQHHMIRRILPTYLFLLPINEIPVVSQFCSPSFPELQEYCGCREWSGISHIIDQPPRVTHRVIDNDATCSETV